MFEEFSKRNRAIQAALELAAEGGWRSVTFTAIAERTGLSLADLRREFTCKADILKGHCHVNRKFAGQMTMAATVHAATVAWRHVSIA